MEFPNCDLPISQLFIQTYLPEDYKYGEFTGMREVRYPSRTPPASQVVSGSAPMGMPQMQVKMDRMEKMEKMEREKDVSMFSNSQRLGGILPVKVDVPTIGKPYYFEQQLGKRI